MFMCHLLTLLNGFLACVLASACTANYCNFDPDQEQAAVPEPVLAPLLSVRL